MSLKILGISGSPVKGGNVEYLLDHALQSVASDDVATEAVHLSRLDVAGCRHCNWCLKKQTAERYCNANDGMTEIYPKLTAADGVLLATPVHIGRLSGQLACLIDRTRAYVHGTVYRSGLRDKVGGGLAVAYFRNSGAERALMDLHWFFHTLGLVVASPQLPHLGGIAYSSQNGEGRPVREERHAVKLDEFGLRGAEATAARMVELLRWRTT